MIRQTCTWPNHDDPDCARCAVLRACLAQVPDGVWYQSAFADEHGYAPDSSRFEGWQKFSNLVNDEPHKVGPWVAGAIADRLGRWARWHGRHVCSSCDEPEVRRHGGWVMACDCIAVPAQVHPLDGTPVAGLRLAVRACSSCHGKGDIDIPEAETVLYCCQTGRETDWPALAVIARYLDKTGPLLDFALAYEPPAPRDGIIPMVTRRLTASHDDLLVAEDIARAAGHPVNAWKADPGMWQSVHEWREPHIKNRRRPGEAP